MSAVRRRQVQWLAMALALVGAVLGIAAAADGWPDLTTHLRDDAFYEFAWACNLARGLGPGVSDGARTTGVQPLWCLLLAWLANGQPGLTPTVAVVLGLLCHLVGALSFAVAGRWQPVALTAGLLWLGNPLLLRECQNGQETALACAFAALLWHMRRAGRWWFFAIGTLAVLARTELWLLVLALAAARPDRRLALPLAVGALGPLLLWNLAITGRLLPDSAWPMVWRAHAALAAAEPGWLPWLQQQWWFTRPVLLGGPFELASATGLGALVFAASRGLWPAWSRPLLLLATGLAALVGTSNLWTPAIAGALLWVYGGGPAPQRGRGAPQRLLLLALVAIVALHWAVRWQPRDYYVAPLALGAAVGVLGLRRAPWALLAIVAATAWPRPLADEPLRHQRAMAVAGRVVADLLPDLRVGSFNAGILAFAQVDPRPSARIVNLDGVVDRRAFDALQHGRLQSFLDDVGVRFVADHPVQFALDPALPHACGRWFGDGFDPDRDLVPLVRCVEPGVDAGRPGTGEFTLYWRRGHGAPLALPTAARELPALPGGTAVVLWPAAAGAALEVEFAAGERRVHWTAPRAGVYALALAPAARGTGRLFERGAAAPLLTLRAPD